MEKANVVALSLGFTLNLSYVTNHACEQKRHSQKGGGIPYGNQRKTI